MFQKYCCSLYHNRWRWNWAVLFTATQYQVCFHQFFFFFFNWRIKNNLEWKCRKVEKKKVYSFSRGGKVCTSIKSKMEKDFANMMWPCDAHGSGDLNTTQAASTKEMKISDLCGATRWLQCSSNCYKDQTFLTCFVIFLHHLFVPSSSSMIQYPTAWAITGSLIIM